MTTEIRNMVDADGSASFQRALGFAGTNQANMQPALLPISKPGIWPALNLAMGNTVLTLALSRSGVLCSTGSGSTSIQVPLLASIADIGSYTFDANNPNGIFFTVQRRGLGGLFVNFDVGVTIHRNDLDPANLPQWHPPVTYLLVGANEWVEC